MKEATFEILRDAQPNRVEIRFPAPPSTSIRRDLRHADFDHSPDYLLYHQPLYAQTVMLAIRATQDFNRNLHH